MVTGRHRPADDVRPAQQHPVAIEHFVDLTTYLPLLTPERRSTGSRPAAAAALAKCPGGAASRAGIDRPRVGDGGDEVCDRDHLDQRRVPKIRSSSAVRVARRLASGSGPRRTTTAMTTNCARGRPSSAARSRPRSRRGGAKCAAKPARAVRKAGREPAGGCCRALL